MPSADFEIIRYNPSMKKDWDLFVEKSKNATFLFNRDYMDYHSDRFTDNSLLFFRKGKLYAMLPASRAGETLFSHQGLTYGGLIMSNKCSAEGILDLFSYLLQYLKTEGVKRLVYKPVPYIYHTIPSQEDLYALFRFNAILSIRNISSTIDIPYRLNFAKDRRAAVRKAENHRISVTNSSNPEPFWKILENNLKTKYSATPVHTLDEMKRLMDLFPDNIKLFTAFNDDGVLAGVVCYICGTTVHTQYISASPEGKEFGAVDFIIKHLLEVVFKDFRYLDLGTSNENNGRILNESLIYQKQGFGGRAICYDTYELRI